MMGSNFSPTSANRLEGASFDSAVRAGDVFLPPILTSFAEILPMALVGVSAFLAVVFLVGAFERLLPAYRRRFFHGVSDQLERAHLFFDPVRLFALNLSFAAILTIGLWVASGSALLALLASVLAGVIPKVMLTWIRVRRRTRFRAQLSDLLMLTAGGLRAGMSLVQSLSQTAAEIEAPARQELELMLREQRLGAPFEQVLTQLERRMPLEETALLCAALRISRETGGNLAETLESLADSMRRKIGIEEKILALTAQGRLQGWAMGLLPVLCGFLLSLIEPDAMATLFSTWYGMTTCVVIAIMQLLGLYFMRRVMRIDV